MHYPRTDSSWTLPINQPRAIIVGITISSIIGVGMARLFALRVPPGTFPSNYENDWAAAATAGAVSLLVCQILESP